MPMTFKSPSGRLYTWNKDTPPTPEDWQALQAHEAEQESANPVRFNGASTPNRGADTPDGVKSTVRAQDGSNRPEIPQLRAYNPGLMERLNDSELRHMLFGPSQHQRDQIEQNKRDVGADGRPDTVEERGAFPAVVSAAADSMGGGLDKLVGNHFTNAGATMTGAIKGEQLGAPLGPYGRLAGAALGGGIGYGTDRFRQWMAGRGTPATPGELTEATINSAAAPVSLGRSAVLNSLKMALTNGAQVATGDATRQLIDNGKVDVGSAGSAGIPAAVITAALGALGKVKGTGNAVKDRTMQWLREQGYIIPDGANSALDNILKSIAGKDAVKQAASNLNAENANRLARKANNMAPDADLTEDAMRDLVAAADAKGYQPLRKIGNIPTDPQYIQELANAHAASTGASRSFPTGGPDPVKETLAPLGVSQFDAGDALLKIQSLRDQASEAFANKQRLTGNALRSAAKAMEDQIERHLESLAKAPPPTKNVTPGTGSQVMVPGTTLATPGQSQYSSGNAPGPANTQAAELLANYRQARTDKAKALTTLDAIRNNSGQVIPGRLAKKSENEYPLTDGLDAIGSMANNFSDFSKDPGKLPMIGTSKVQAGLAALMGTGTAATTHDPVMTAAASVAPYVSSNVARAIVTNKAYQAAINKRIINDALAREMARAARISENPDHTDK